MLKVGVAGAGAVGCHYGSLLQQAGLDVVYLARGEHLAAMQRDGLIHQSGGKTIRLKIAASDDVAMLAGCDVILLTCKTTVLDELCAQLAPVVSSQTLFITMQNGVAAPDRVANRFPESVVVAASAFIGVRIEPPGTIIHSAAGHLRLGRWSDDSAKNSPLLTLLIDSWKRSGCDAAAVADMRSMLWNKMLWNCGFNAMTALTRRFAKDIAACEDSLRWVRAAMQEAIDVAAASGIGLPADVIEQHLKLTMVAGPVKTSMWQDIEHGRPTEIEAMNGYVAQQAKELGLPAPVNDLLASLIRSAEKGSD